MDQQILIAAGVAAAVLAALAFFMLTKRTPKFLNGTRQQLPISKKEYVSHDTVKFTFNMPKGTPDFGLPTGKHIKIYCPNAKGKVAGEWNGRDDLSADETEILRPYTPASVDPVAGKVELVIKVYKGGVNEKFVDGGKMSQYLDTLEEGDEITVMGPTGMKTYEGKGTFKVQKGKDKFTTATCKKLGMMAGGTGITPMLQVAAAILDDPDDKTEISLLYANQTEDDILVRDLLEEYAAKYPKQFKVWYTLDRPPARWKYSSGFITDTMIAEHLPGPKEDSLVIMCGPPPMIKFACEANLDKLGYVKEQRIQW